jgi:hypothetical protein
MTTTTPYSAEQLRKLLSDYLDFNIETDDLAARTRAAIAALSQQAALPFAILDDELAALRRFHECVSDGEGYDVPKPMMKRLAEIGLLRHVSAGYYEHTVFGLAVLDGEFASQPHPTGDTQAPHPEAVKWYAGDTQQEAEAWMWRRNYDNGGYATELCNTREHAESLKEVFHNGKTYDEIIPLFTHPPEASALAQQVKDKAVEALRELMHKQTLPTHVSLVAKCAETIAAISIPEPRPDALVAMAYRKAAAKAAEWVSPLNDNAATQIVEAIESLTPPDAQAALEELCMEVALGVEATYSELDRGCLPEAELKAIVRATLNQQRED